VQFSFKRFSKSKSRFGLDTFLRGLIRGVYNLESADFEHFTNKGKSLLMSKNSSTFVAEFRSEFVRLVYRANQILGLPVAILVTIKTLLKWQQN
jgi:hypothetical protein